MNVRLPASWREFWRSLPAFIRIYLFFYFLSLFLLVFWVPGNDYDTMATYIVRIKLEEFGDLHKTATTQLQYIFPKFYDYLHQPFLKFGYFTTLPNFALFFVTWGLLLRYLPNRERLVLALLTMSASPILLQITSQNNDFAVAAFAVIAWYIIMVLPRSLYYLPLSVLALAALAGTKWFGGFVIAPLTVVLLYRMFTTHKPSASQWALTLFATPLYWYVSSANVYLDNMLRFGRPDPRPAWLSGQVTGIAEIPVNAYKFISSSIIETFDLPLYFIDRLFNWKIWHFEQLITMGGKTHNYAFMINSEFAYFGAGIIVVLVCSAIVVFRSSEDAAVRVAAAVALFYMLGVMTVSVYSTWVSRYYMAAYALGMIPTARLLARVRFPKPAIVLAVAYAFIISMQVLLLNQEKRLVPITWWFPDSSSGTNLDTIYPDLLDRDRLYFQVWSGYVHVYEAMQREIQLSDGLVFVNNGPESVPPFLYPLLKDRLAANTRIINTENGDRWNPRLCQDFPYVMVYGKELEDSQYERIYQYPGEYQMAIYRRVAGACKT